MLVKSGLIVAFFTLLSRIFGLAREFFIAYTFGTSYIADCVNVAFKFPNLFRRIFAEGALSSVFIPMFSKKLISSTAEAKNFSGKIFSLLIFILVIFVAIIEIFMPYIVALIAPGFYGDYEKFNLAILLCRITTPYLIFISIAALLGGILNSVKKFAAFAFVPIIMNVSLIAFTYGAQNYYPAYYGISYSLIIAGALQVTFMFLCLYKAGLTFPILFNIRDKEVLILIKKMGPATLSSGTQQLNLFISQSIASFIPGAISILSYADRLYQLPLALVGITFSTILLPELSQMYKNKNYQEAKDLQNKSIQIAMLISIPATFGLCALSYPIISLIYERGEFLATDTKLTAQALAVFSLGLPSFVLAKIITPIYYANLDTHNPLRISLYSMAANIILNILLMIPLNHVGIALGSSIASWFNVWLLYKHAKQYGNYAITYKTKIFIFKTTISSFAMLFFIYITYPYFSEMFYSVNFIAKALGVFCDISASICIFLVTSYCLKLHKILGH